MPNQPQPVELVESKSKSFNYAIWSGIELKLPSGRVLSFLFCSEECNGSGFFVEGAKPSDGDEGMVQCRNCETLHHVVALPDALEEGALQNLDDVIPSIRIEELLAIMIRDGGQRAS